MSSKGVTPGTTTVQQKQGAWTPAPPQRFRQRRTRLTPGATLADVVTAFNQQADELERVTASARDIASARTLYAGVAFVSGVVQRFAHKLGSANVSMSHSSPRATPGVTAGNPWVIWQVDPKNPDLVIVSPAGTFTCDLEFRIAPPFTGAETLGPTGGFTPPSGTGAVVSVNGVESVAAGTTGQVLTSTGPTTAPTFQTIAAGGGGWLNATLGVNGTLDFTLQASQALGTDGNYTIGGATFTKVNSANDATPMVLTLGTGVVVKPVASTQFFAGTRTAPMLLLDLAAVIPTFAATTEVEISAYWSAQNPTANFDEAFIGIDTGTVMPIAWRAGIAFNAAKGQQIVATFNGGGVGSVNQTASGNADVVEILTLPTGVGQVQGTLVSSATAYAGGVWPIGTFRCNTNAGGGGVNNLPTSQSFLFAMGAQRQGSATAFSATLAAIRVRYKA